MTPERARELATAHANDSPNHDWVELAILAATAEERREALSWAANNAKERAPAVFGDRGPLNATRDACLSIARAIESERDRADRG